MTGKSFKFFYDIVCPYAYMASRHVNAISTRTGSRLEYVPVLLGGLYRDTQAPQGANGSASDLMTDAKRRLQREDLTRHLERASTPINKPHSHPQRTVDAMRLCAVAPTGQIGPLTDDLYMAYWVSSEDVSSPGLLDQLANKHRIPAGIYKQDEAKEKLRANTDMAVSMGIFGVPTFAVEGTDGLIFGNDRLPFLERALGYTAADFPRLIKGSARPGTKLTFYFDFSSPWSYLGWSQVERIAREAGAELEFVPVLLGALFKSVGQVNVPMAKLSNAQRANMELDMKRWSQWWKVPIQFPDVFPIRTVNPLRVAIVEPKTIGVLYKAAWANNKNIGDDDVLHEILAAGGFDAPALMSAMTDDRVKEQLRANTQRALVAGACGAPTYQIDDGPLVFGQDRAHIVLDLLCGWRVPDGKYDNVLAY